MATGGLYTDIKSILEQARANAFRAVNFAMVVAYWEIGRRIVEEEQQGEDRANYGAAILKELSKKLTIDFGKGFSAVSLENFRKFYLVFSDRPISSTVWRILADEASGSQIDPDAIVSPVNQKSSALRRELSWSHYRLLMRVENEDARNYYMN